MNVQLMSATPKQLAYTIAKLEGFSVKIKDGELLVKKTAAGSYEEYSPVDNIEECLAFEYNKYEIRHETKDGITTAITYAKNEDKEKYEIKVQHSNECLAIIYAYIKSTICDVIVVPDQLVEQNT